MLSMFIKKLLFTRQFFYDQGKLDILNWQSIVLPIDALVKIQKEHPETCFDAIKESVMHQCMSYTNQLHIPKEKFAEPLSHIFELYGIGRLVIHDLDFEHKHALVEVHDTSLISKYNHGDKPICSITCGVLSGIFSAVFDTQVRAKVNKCKAEGHIFCEFIIK